MAGMSKRRKERRFPVVGRDMILSRRRVPRRSQHLDTFKMRLSAISGGGHLAWRRFPPRMIPQVFNIFCHFIVTNYLKLKVIILLLPLLFSPFLLWCGKDDAFEMHKQT